MGMLAFQGTKDTRSVAVNVRSRLQSPCTTLRKCGIAEGRHRIDHRIAWTAISTGLHRDHKSAPVLRATPGVTPVALAAQVRVV